MIEFGQPAALWSALAIGLPVLAHMAYRRVTEKYFFPSLRFIRPSQIPRTGKRTPSDIPLLLLRILLFIILSMLLADPYWKSDLVNNSDEKKEEIIFAIDLSPSMTGWKALEEAKEKIKSYLRNTEANLGLILFSNSVLEKFDIGTPKELLISKVDELQNDWTKGNAQGMMDAVVAMFSEQTVSRKLVIVSDFQQPDWQTTYSDLAQAGINYELLEVGQKTVKEGRRQNNLSIVEARAVPAGPGKIRIWTVIKNWDDMNKTVDLDLVAGGQVRGSEVLSISPLGSTQSQFVIKEGDFAEASVVIRQQDEFQLDNQRSLWLKAPPARRFGFWIPEQEDDETAQEQSFLKTAVSSAGDNGWNRWVWDQEKADGIRLGDDQLMVDFLMVLGVGKWFEEEQVGNSLKAFLNRGGVAMITPGTPFSSAVSVLKPINLMEYNFVRVAGGAVRNRNPFRIGALPEDSFLSEVFEGKAARDLYLSAIHQFGILKPSSRSSSTEVPLLDRQGRPLALIKKFEGGGRLVFLPFRMNTSWTDLPLRNSFLPLLMELSKKENNLLSDRSWPVLEPGQTLEGNQGTFLAEKPGVYRFEDQWIEVVLSASECTPICLSKNELSTTFGDGTIVEVIPFSRSTQQSDEKNPLWVWFAILSVGLLIIEMLWSRPKFKPSSTQSVHA